MTSRSIILKALEVLGEASPSEIYAWYLQNVEEEPRKKQGSLRAEASRLSKGDRPTFVQHLPEGKEEARYTIATVAATGKGSPAEPSTASDDDDEFVPISALDKPREPVHERNGSARPETSGPHPAGAERAWFFVTLPNGARRYYDAAFNLVAWEGEPAFLGAVNFPAPPEPAR